MPTINIPNDSIKKEDNNKTLIQLWEQRVGTCVKQLATLDNNIALAYSLVWEQHYYIMRTKVDANKKCGVMRRYIDMIILIASINNISYR